MEKEKIIALVERYEAKAETAAKNYLETGITRYDTSRRSHEDMADALRIAANAADDHAKLVYYRGEFAALANRAGATMRLPEMERAKQTMSVLKDLLTLARMDGLIRDDRGENQ